jgi:hypothetical protein
MPEWLQRTFPNGLETPLEVLAARLGLAFVLGCGVAAVYRWTHRKDADYTPTFVTTLVLLAVLIAVVTQVIGNSTGKALSLVGALSIVRFRTLVRDTRDTAFVVFAVVEGMSAGGGQLPMAVAGFCAAAVAAAVFRPRSTRGGGPVTGWILKVRVGVGNGDSPAAVLREVLDRHLAAAEPQAAATGRQGAAIDLTYRVRLRPTTDPTVLVAELNRLEGVQNVELNQPPSAIN